MISHRKHHHRSNFSCRLYNGIRKGKENMFFPAGSGEGNHFFCSFITALLLLLLTAGFSAPLHAQDRDTLRKILHEVIAQEKFTYDAGDMASVSPRENTLLDKINRFLETLWNRITKALEKASWLTIILYVLMIAAIAFIFIMIFRRLDLSRRVPRHTSRSADTEEFNMDYQRELKRAETYVMEGEKKRAVSTAVNALWLYLHHKGVLRYMKSTTNREYLSVMEDTGTYPLVPEIIRDSETAVYADSTVHDEQCNEILSKIITITAQ